VLYITGAVLLIVAEIFARAQLCCDERKSVYWTLAVLVIASGTDTHTEALYPPPALWIIYSVSQKIPPEVI